MNSWTAKAQQPGRDEDEGDPGPAEEASQVEPARALVERRRRAATATARPTTAPTRTERRAPLGGPDWPNRNRTVSRPSRMTATKASTASAVRRAIVERAIDRRLKLALDARAPGGASRTASRSRPRRRRPAVERLEELLVGPARAADGRRTERSRGWRYRAIAAPTPTNTRGSASRRPSLDQVGADDPDDEGGFDALTKADEKAGTERAPQIHRSARSPQGVHDLVVQGRLSPNLPAPAKTVKRHGSEALSRRRGSRTGPASRLASRKPPRSTTASTATLTDGASGSPGRPAERRPRRPASPGGSTGTWSPPAARTGRPPRSACRRGRAGARAT